MKKNKKNRNKKNTTMTPEAREQMILEANARHDAQYGSNPEIVKYYTDYIPGTGLRQSK